MYYIFEWIQKLAVNIDIYAADGLRVLRLCVLVVVRTLNKNETRRLSGDGTLHVFNTLSTIALYYRYKRAYKHIFFQFYTKNSYKVCSQITELKYSLTGRYIENSQVFENQIIHFYITHVSKMKSQGKLENISN